MIQGLTVLQPYATCIVLGPKRVENRPWRRKLPAGGMWIAIHAGKNPFEMSRAVWNGLRTVWPETPLLSEMPLGAILGIARVVAIRPIGDVQPNVWACGPYCWMLEDVLPLAQPIAYRGAQGLWPIEPVVHSQLARLRDDHLSRSA